MVSRHGENFDWRAEPINPEVVYASGGGKAHGRCDLSYVLKLCTCDANVAICN